MCLPLHELIGGLSIADRIPQIEVAVSDYNDRCSCFRNLLPLSREDEPPRCLRRRNIASRCGSSPEASERYRLNPKNAPNTPYTLPEFDSCWPICPRISRRSITTSTRLLIRRAMQLLDPQPGTHCRPVFGLGNFSLPDRPPRARVIGVEAATRSSRVRARTRVATGSKRKASFIAANLFEATEDSLAALGPLDKLLIDPPREGAIAVVKALGPQQLPPRIVYVSCNPATLARDAAVLVREKGYRLAGAGIANMFPQTSHVESIALFERD